jgi:hypothetical protein
MKTNKAKPASTETDDAAAKAAVQDAADLKRSEQLFRANLRPAGPWLYINSEIERLSAEIASLRAMGHAVPS